MRHYDNGNETKEYYSKGEMGMLLQQRIFGGQTRWIAPGEDAMYPRGVCVVMVFEKTREGQKPKFTQLPMTKQHLEWLGLSTVVP